MSPQNTQSTVTSQQHSFHHSQSQRHASTNITSGNQGSYHNNQHNSVPSQQQQQHSVSGQYFTQQHYHLQSPHQQGYSQSQQHLIVSPTTFGGAYEARCGDDNINRN